MQALNPAGTGFVGASPVPPWLLTMQEYFSAKGVEAYLVGGAVRDALLGRATADVDVAVVAEVTAFGHEVAASLGGRYVPLDEELGIIRVIVPWGAQAWSVDITSAPGGIMADLKRRDFSIDAMAVPMADAASRLPWEHILDPFNGLSDLRTGVIRALVPTIFEVDPARLMRAPRLATQLGFSIAEDTARQIRRDASLVANVAPERVRDELMKLVAQPGAATWLRRLDDLELLCQIIPELANAKGVLQPKEHYWDVFNHQIETVGQIELILGDEAHVREFPGDMAPRFESMGAHFAEEISDGHSRLTLLKLAGLLHDIGKPATKTVESTGRIRFLGHHSEGAEISARILGRLRFSRRGTELVGLMIEHHLRPRQMSQGGELPTGKAIYRYFRDLGDAAIGTLYLSLADYLAARGPMMGQQEWSEHCRAIRYVLAEGLQRSSPASMPKLVDGNDIMKVFALAPGPQVGLLLDYIREAQANGEVTTPEEALALAKKSLKIGDSSAQVL